MPIPKSVRYEGLGKFDKNENFFVVNEDSLANAKNELQDAYIKMHNLRASTNKSFREQAFTWVEDAASTIMNEAVKYGKLAPYAGLYTLGIFNSDIRNIANMFLSGKSEPKDRKFNSDYDKYDYIMENYLAQMAELNHLDKLNKNFKRIGYYGIPVDPLNTDYTYGASKLTTNILSYGLSPSINVFYKPQNWLNSFLDWTNYKKQELAGDRNPEYKPNLEKRTLGLSTMGEQYALFEKIANAQNNELLGMYINKQSRSWNNVIFSAASDMAGLAMDMKYGVTSVFLKGFKVADEVHKVNKLVKTQKIIDIYKHIDPTKLSKIPFYTNFGRIVQAGLKDKVLRTPIGEMKNLESITGMTIPEMLLKKPAEVGFAVATARMVDGETNPEEFARTFTNMFGISHVSNLATIGIRNFLTAFYMPMRTMSIAGTPQNAVGKVANLYDTGAQTIYKIAAALGDASGFMAKDFVDKNYLGSQSMFGDKWKDAFYNLFMGFGFHVGNIKQAAKQAKSDKAYMRAKRSITEVTTDQEKANQVIESGVGKVTPLLNQQTGDVFYAIEKSFGDKVLEKFGTDEVDTQSILDFARAEGVPEKHVAALEATINKIGKGKKVLIKEIDIKGSENTPAIFDGENIILNRKVLIGRKGEEVSAMGTGHNDKIMANNLFSIIAHEINHNELAPRYLENNGNNTFNKEIKAATQPIFAYMETAEFKKQMDNNPELREAYENVMKADPELRPLELAARTHELHNFLAEHLKKVNMPNTNLSMFDKVMQPIAKKLFGTPYKNSMFQQVYDLASEIEVPLETNYEPNKDNTLEASMDVLKSEQFKNFFGDWENDPDKAGYLTKKNLSQVKDEPVMVRTMNGYVASGFRKPIPNEPVPLYHGTQTTNLGTNENPFRVQRGNRAAGDNLAGIYLTTNPSHASSYAESGDRSDRNFRDKGTANVLQVYANIKNPIIVRIMNRGDDMPDASDYWLSDRFGKPIPKYDINNPGERYYFEEEYRNIRDMLPEEVTMQDYVDSKIKDFEGENQPEYPSYFTLDHLDYYKSLGYDGVVYNGGDEVIVFDPTQIKSAIGNRGTYDSNNPNILESSHDLFARGIKETDKVFTELNRYRYNPNQNKDNNEYKDEFEGFEWQELQITNFLDGIGYSKQEDFIKDAYGKTAEEIYQIIKPKLYPLGEITPEEDLDIKRKAIQAQNLMVINSVYLAKNDIIPDYNKDELPNGKKVNRVFGVNNYYAKWLEDATNYYQKSFSSLKPEDLFPFILMKQAGMFKPVANERSTIDKYVVSKELRKKLIDKGYWLPIKDKGNVLYHMPELAEINKSPEMAKEFYAKAARLELLRLLDSQTLWKGNRPRYGGKDFSYFIQHLNLDKIIDKYVLGKDIKIESIQDYSTGIKFNENTMPLIDLVGNKLKEILKDDYGNPIEPMHLSEKQYEPSQYIENALNGLMAMSLDNGMDIWINPYNDKKINGKKFKQKYIGATMNPAPLWIKNKEQLAWFMPDAIMDNGEIDRGYLARNKMGVDKNDNVYIPQFIWQSDLFDKHPLLQKLVPYFKKNIHDGGTKIISPEIWGLLSKIIGSSKTENGVIKGTASATDMTLKNSDQFLLPESNNDSYFANWLRTMSNSVGVIGHDTNYKDTYHDVIEEPCVFNSEYTLVTTKQGKWLYVKDANGKIKSEYMQQEVDKIAEDLLQGKLHHTVKRYITGDEAFKFINAGGHAGSQGFAAGVINSTAFYRNSNFFRGKQYIFDDIVNSAKNLANRLAKDVYSLTVLHNLTGSEKGLFNNDHLAEAAKGVEIMKDWLMKEFENKQSQRSFVFAVDPNRALEVLNNSVENGMLKPEMIPVLTGIFQKALVGQLRNPTGFGTMIAFKIRDLLDSSNKARFYGSSGKLIMPGDEGYWVGESAAILAKNMIGDYDPAKIRDAELELYPLVQQLYEENIDPETGMFLPNSHGVIISEDILDHLNKSKERTKEEKLTLGSKVMLNLTPNSGLESWYPAQIIGVSRRKGEIRMNPNHSADILSRDYDFDGIGIFASSIDMPEEVFNNIHQHWTKQWNYLERQSKNKRKLFEMMHEPFSGSNKFNKLMQIDEIEKVNHPLHPNYTESVRIAATERGKGIGTRSALAQGLNALNWTMKDGKDRTTLKVEYKLEGQPVQLKFYLARSTKEEGMPGQEGNKFVAYDRTAALDGMSQDGFVDGFNYNKIDNINLLLDSIVESVDVNGKNYSIKKLSQENKSKLMGRLITRLNEISGMKHVYDFKNSDDMEAYQKAFAQESVSYEHSNSTTKNYINEYRKVFGEKNIENDKPQAKIAIPEQQVQAETNKPNYISFGEFKAPKNRAEGTPADKAMREVADGFIGEVVNNNSSSQTSRNHLIDKTNKRGVSGFTTDWVQGVNDENAKIIMLARNSEVAKKIKELNQDTKTMIRKANANGAEFIIGNSWIDKPFHDYLNEIGAKYTIYGHEGANRIPLRNETITNGVSPKDANNVPKTVNNVSINKNNNLRQPEWEAAKWEWERAESVRKEFKEKIVEIKDLMPPELKNEFINDFGKQGIPTKLMNLFAGIHYNKSNKGITSENATLFTDLPYNNDIDKTISGTILHYYIKFNSAIKTKINNIFKTIIPGSISRYAYENGMIKEVNNLTGETLNGHEVHVDKLFNPNGELNAEWLPWNVVTSPEFQALFSRESISDSKLTEMKANLVANIAIALEPKYNDVLDRNSLFSLLGFAPVSTKEGPVGKSIAGRQAGTFLSSIPNYPEWAKNIEDKIIESGAKSQNVSVKEAREVFKKETGEDILDVIRYAKEKNINPDMVGNQLLEDYVYDKMKSQGKEIFGSNNVIKRESPPAMEAGIDLFYHKKSKLKDFDDMNGVTNPARLMAALKGGLGGEDLRNLDLTKMTEEQYNVLYDRLLGRMIKKHNLDPELENRMIRAFSPSVLDEQGADIYGRMISPYEDARSHFAKEGIGQRAFNAIFLENLFYELREAHKYGKGSDLTQFNPYVTSIPEWLIDERSSVQNYYPLDYVIMKFPDVQNGEQVIGETIQGDSKTIADLAQLSTLTQKYSGLHSRAVIEEILPLRYMHEIKDRMNDYLKSRVYDAIRIDDEGDFNYAMENLDSPMYQHVIKYITDNYEFSDRTSYKDEQCRVRRKDGSKEFDPNTIAMSAEIDNIANATMVANPDINISNTFIKKNIKDIAKAYIHTRTMAGMAKNYLRTLSIMMDQKYGSNSRTVVNDKINAFLENFDVDNPRTLKRAMRDINFMASSTGMIDEVISMINEMQTTNSQGREKYLANKAKLHERMNAMPLRIGNKDARQLAKYELEKEYIENEPTDEAHERAMDVIGRAYDDFQNRVANIDNLESNIKELEEEGKLAGNKPLNEYYDEKHKQLLDKANELGIEIDNSGMATEARAGEIYSNAAEESQAMFDKTKAITSEEYENTRLESSEDYAATKKSDWEEFKERNSQRWTTFKLKNHDTWESFKKENTDKWTKAKEAMSLEWRKYRVAKELKKAAYYANKYQNINTPASEHFETVTESLKDYGLKLEKAIENNLHLSDRMDVMNEEVNYIENYISQKRNESNYAYDLLHEIGVKEFATPFSKLKNSEMRQLGKIAVSTVQKIFANYTNRLRENTPIIKHQAKNGAPSSDIIEYSIEVPVIDPKTGKEIKGRKMMQARPDYIAQQFDLVDLLEANWKLKGNEPEDKLHKYDFDKFLKMTENLAVNAMRKAEGESRSRAMAMGETNQLISKIVTDQLSKSSKNTLQGIYNGLVFTPSTIRKELQEKRFDTTFAGSPVQIRYANSSGETILTESRLIGIANARVEGAKNTDNKNYIIVHNTDRNISQVIEADSIIDMTIGNPYGFLNKQMAKGYAKLYKKHADKMLDEFSRNTYAEYYQEYSITHRVKPQEAAEFVPDDEKGSFYEYTSNPNPLRFENDALLSTSDLEKATPVFSKGFRDIQEGKNTAKMYKALKAIMDWENASLVGTHYLKLGYLASAGINAFVLGNPAGALMDIGSYAMGMIVRSKLANQLGMAAVLGRQSMQRKEHDILGNAFAGFSGTMRGITAGATGKIVEKKKRGESVTSAKEMLGLVINKDFATIATEMFQGYKHEDIQLSKNKDKDSEFKGRIREWATNAVERINPAKMFVDLYYNHRAKDNVKAYTKFYQDYNDLMMAHEESPDNITYQAILNGLEKYKTGQGHLINWNKSAKQRLELHKIGDDIIPFIDGKVANEWQSAVAPVKDIMLYAASLRGWTQQNELASAQRAYRAGLIESYAGLNAFKKACAKKFGVMEDFSTNLMYLDNRASLIEKISIGDYNRLPGHKTSTGRFLTMYEAFSKSNVVDQTTYLKKRQQMYAEIMDIMSHDKEFMDIAKTIGIPMGDGLLYRPLNEIKNAILPAGANVMINSLPKILAMTSAGSMIKSLLYGNSLYDDMFNIFFQQSFSIPFAIATVMAGALDVLTLQPEMSLQDTFGEKVGGWLEPENVNEPTELIVRKAIRRTAFQTGGAVRSAAAYGYGKSLLSDFVIQTGVIGLWHYLNVLRQNPAWDSFGEDVKYEMLQTAIENSTRWIPGAAPAWSTWKKRDGNIFLPDKPREEEE